MVSVVAVCACIRVCMYTCVHVCMFASAHVCTCRKCAGVRMYLFLTRVSCLIHSHRRRKSSKFSIFTAAATVLSSLRSLKGSG